MLTERRSGILMHPTSLPGSQPVGSLGKEAYAFIDALVEAGQSVWQILPLGPTGYGDCPYSCFSAFAGNPLLINLSLLTETGELKKTDLPPSFPGTDRVDFPSAHEKILPLLNLAFLNFKNIDNTERQNHFEQFCSEQSFWLDDYSLFQALRERYDLQAWNTWPDQIKRRNDSALRQAREELSDKIDFHKFIQFIFLDQWVRLKSYANEHGILIFGDLPIFVAEDSADVWSNQRYFHLDDNGHPTLVAGVPPDYFSTTGQRWGNPLYHWDLMKEDNFSWWKARFRWNLNLFDLLRVDHFRGFSACWAIPSGHHTAEHGYWMEAPGKQLFGQLIQESANLPLIAEDLGIITPDVTNLRDQFNLPGMKILQFAFDSGSDNPYQPHNLAPNSVIYTGTHDNNTTLGWWRAIDAGMKQQIKTYLRNPCREMPWPLIETALSSVSALALCPMQDALSLPSSSRINTPGTAHDNWQWRMRKDAFTPEIRSRMKNLSHLYGRNLCITTEM
jgi:4-alpha-glucanotransferase